MPSPEELAAYVGNLRVMLRADEARFASMAERQIQFALLRGLVGSRAALEGPLWELLLLCLEGPAAEARALDDATWERAITAITSARFPRAAQAVAGVLASVRENGIYPPPKLKGATT